MIQINQYLIRGGLFLVSILAVLASSCTVGGSLARQANRSFIEKDWDKAVALYSRLVHQYPDRVEFQSRFWWARLRAAEVHLNNGEQALKKNNLEKALVELEMAADLDPANGEIYKKLAQVREHFRTGRNTSAMEPLSLPKFDIPSQDILKKNLSLNLVQTPIPDIFRALARAAELQLILDPNVPTFPVDADFRGVTVVDALDRLTRIARCFYRFLNNDTLLISPDNEENRQKYADYWAYSIPVQFTRAQNVSQVLRNALQLPYIAHDPSKEVITIMGTRSQIEAAVRIAAKVDHPPAEVLIHVDILEIAKTMLQQYGLSFRTENLPGVEPALVPEKSLTLDPGPILSRSDFTLVNLPDLVARMLKQSGHTRLLASIPIRTIDGETGKVRFGSDVPIPQTTFVPIAGGGVNQQPITSFAYRTVGLSIDLTPRVNPDGLITIQLRVESSSVAGSGFGGVPILATSLIEKTIRVQPGETSMIAGLIRQQTRETVTSTPGLEHVPIIGELFKDRRKEGEENELIILLTPIIIRQRPFIEGDDAAIPVPPPKGQGERVMPYPRPWPTQIPEMPEQPEEIEDNPPPA